MQSASTLTDTPKASKPIRVLMVCLGNICRSPTAHGVLMKMAVDRGLEELIEVDSAGTADYHVGKHPDPRSVAAASTRGYELGGLVARQVCTEDFTCFDHILAMNTDNLSYLKSRSQPEQQGKIRLLLSVPEGQQLSVPDPYYGGEAGFERVLDLIEDACSSLLDDIVAEHLPRLGKAPTE